MSGAAAARFRVRAVHCDHGASDEEVYRSLRRATDPLDRAWERLGKARRIAIKLNQDWPPDRVVMHAGHRQQLVSDPVARAVLRLLRERTRAELVAVDIGVEGMYAGLTDGSSTLLQDVFHEFDVPFVECSREGTIWTSVPGGGRMFDRYPLPRPVVESDALVSVQKLKSHQFMGITLCLKNLFALMSIQPAGRPRTYYHHLVRLPYVLADLGRILDPALNILDGLVTQAGREWGPGDHPRICDTLAAGDHAVATDACGAHLMGHDPAADWLTPPFHRDRNALAVAAEGGLGTVELKEIDFQSEVTAPVGEFFARTVDPNETVVSWRRTTAEQALFYRDRAPDLRGRYAGQYILLQMGQVRWSGDAADIRESRRVLAGEHPEQALWMKYVEHEDSEGEHYEVYEETLRRMRGMGLA
ncbi:MAG TPA: DUF362 domain-containing protein [Spirochaetia bacterium]|nr:DUF362 domain-containing protein [Spirochaetia bacterium]